MDRKAKVVLVLLLICIFLQLQLSFWQIFSACIALFALNYFYEEVRKEDSIFVLPPGPKGLPFFGSMFHTMFYGPDDYFSKLLKRYGPIFTLRLGEMKNIVINDYGMMKGFTNHPDFLGRPEIGAIRTMLRGNGVLDSEGARWKHQRKFLIRSLKDSGMGKNGMEDQIIQEMTKVTSAITQAGQTPLQLSKIMEKATCSIMFRLSGRTSFPYDDPKFCHYLEKLIENVDHTEKLLIPMFFPWFESLFSKYQIKLVANINVIYDFASSLVQKHKVSFDRDDPKDVIDLFMVEMEKEEDSEYHSTFTDHQLNSIIVDMFGAGTETTSTTLTWVILYMINFPDIQKKVQEEIDQFVGSERSPTMLDKPNLVFTVATLQEVERLGSVAPRSIPRSNPEPAKFKEYSFPARCNFILNIHAVHNDPKLWNNPGEFCPERFIDSEGKVFRPPYLVPFGTGKRVCVGESLARMELFLIYVILMQKFNFKCPDENRPPPIKASSGIVRRPLPYKVIAEAR